MSLIDQLFDDPHECDEDDTRRKCVNCECLTDGKTDDGDPLCADCEEMT
jgi:hypothetical protein